MFSKSKGYVDLPVCVACGQCIGCRLERSRQWAIRCVHEAQMYDESAFITLTYDDKHLPEDRGLKKKDFQDFMKRLRKHIEPKKIRFYHCGEYGETTLRPHYHALIFGYDFRDKVDFKDGVNGDRIYTSKTLEDIWGYGFCTVGTVSFESAAYCARYVVKKITGDAAEEHYRRVDAETGEIYHLLPEYTTMSNGGGKEGKGGLGMEWLRRYGADVYPEGEMVLRGKVMQPPRYYDKLFELDDPKGMRKIKRERARVGIEHVEDQSYERLRVREKVKKAQVGFLKRSV